MAKAKYTSIGGQALIEGILMKSPEKAALAVRKPDKSIEITDFPAQSVTKKYKFLGVPVIRGVASFIQSMFQGYKAMMLSAELSGYTDLDEGAEKKMDEKKKNALVSGVMVVGTVLGVLLAVALFMYLPRLAVGGLQRVFHAQFPKLARSAIEQLLKLAVFVLYIWAISFMKDIRRVFMYHGAEHKTIFCYEKGQELTVENVRRQRRFHPRCGTSFMILMILISIVFSTLIQMIFPGVYNVRWLWVLAKILMIPLVCGCGYELLKVCGKYDNLFTRVVSAPGLWIQRLTTKEPEDDMIEIAIAALRACEPENPDVDRSVDVCGFCGESPEKEEKEENQEEEEAREHDDISGV